MASFLSLRHIQLGKRGINRRTPQQVKDHSVRLLSEMTNKSIPDVRLQREVLQFAPCISVGFAHATNPLAHAIPPAAGCGYSFAGTGTTVNQDVVHDLSLAL